MAGAVLRFGRLCENFHPHRQNRARTSTLPACHATKPQITDLPKDFDEPLAAHPTCHLIVQRTPSHCCSPRYGDHSCGSLLPNAFTPVSHGAKI